jgi:6,7-dimethyl-8-ribityllumazine synthase
MPNLLEGNFEAKGLRVGIVASRFNEFIVSKLVDGAIDALVRHGTSDEDITIVWVPGSFEIPGVAHRIARPDRYDAIICLGCVIRGSTDHYEYIAAEAAKGIGALAHESSIPVIFGVLTTSSIEQAIERAGTKMGNKGVDAAMAAIEMVNLNLEIDKTLNQNT